MLKQIFKFDNFFLNLIKFKALENGQEDRAPSQLKLLLKISERDYQGTYAQCSERNKFRLSVKAA